MKSKKLKINDKEKFMQVLKKLECRIPTIDVREKFPIIHTLFGNILYIKLLYGVVLLLGYVRFTRELLYPYISLILVYGFLIILYDIFTAKNILKNKFFLLLFFFWTSFAISILVNFNPGFYINVRPIAYMFLEFFVIALVPLNMDSQQYKKNLIIINITLISVITLISLISFIVFAMNLSGHYTILGITAFIGNMPPRLWGITTNPNALGIMSICGVALIIFHLNTFAVKKWPYIVMLIICLSAALLANSRTAMFSFYVFVFLFVFLTFLIRNYSEKKTIKRHIVICLAVATMGLFSVLGLFDRALPLFGYIPGAVSNIQGTISNIFQTDIEQPPIEITPIRPIETVRPGELAATGELTGAGRLTFWTAGLRTFQNNIFFGVGHYRLDYYMSYYNPNPNRIVSAHIHNIYIQILATYGIFPFVYLVVMLIYFTVLVFRLLKDHLNRMIYSPILISCLCIIALLLSAGMFESNILSNARTFTSFLLAHFLGIFLTYVQTDHLQEFETISHD